MNNKVALIAGAAFVCLCVLIFIINNLGRSAISEEPTPFGHVTSSHEDNYREADTYQILQQRNKLSRMLNLKQQTIGQMECERATKGVSKTGGWCSKASNESGGHHMTDRQFAKALAGFFEGKTVASFGDGPGRYKQLIDDTGKLKVYDAFDGGPFSEKTTVKAEYNS